MKTFGIGEEKQIGTFVDVGNCLVPLLYTISSSGAFRDQNMHPEFLNVFTVTAVKQSQFDLDWD